MNVACTRSHIGIGRNPEGLLLLRWHGSIRRRLIYLGLVLAVMCEGKIRPRLPSTVSSGFGAGFDIHIASRLSEVNRDARGTWL